MELYGCEQLRILMGVTSGLSIAVWYSLAVGMEREQPDYDHIIFV